MCKNKQAASKLAGGDKYMRKTSDIGAKKAQDDFMEDQDAVNLAADWADISQGLRKDLGHQLHSQWIVAACVKENQTCIACTLHMLDYTGDFVDLEFPINWVRHTRINRD